ncbi:MAG: ribosome biogenesis GTPase Der [Prolixibacteraceae bacterium]|jgi:GTPase|nr:ribosome biogenesis GTPase Der [Prolixibacteraceae bacterium]MBT6765598.1 ribosome biogenesis GTPase Der [Prolixibacteraceae bacterium]MBT6997169.1 ribosome biogenesis GTPase Der [Prolixibacteraceae bacterium]MBT7396670.1 ribosome biogenesis GTPase Der [Prolixibacteraceae bacterium]
MSSRIVAIVGRPNVGKSTMFNRLIEQRKAIVDEVSGVTRDRNYGKGEWNGVEFSVIDTGGYVVNSDDIFEAEINKQVHLAMDEADVILFVVDVEAGITDLDDAVAAILRRTNKQVILVVNKVDNNQRILDAQEFYGLGLGEIFCISSMTGSGTGDMLDKLVASFPKKVEDDEEKVLPHLSVVGRPNVGKSSFINALIGEDRNIVTDVAGTTRDSIHTRYNKFGHDFMIVDTAGLRKKTKVNEDLEFYSVLRSVRTIENSDVCLLLIDATRGVESQDVNIFNLAVKNKKGVVILVNKWDLIEKDTHSTKKFMEDIRDRIAPFTDVPVLFVSALTKQRVHKALETAIEVFENRKQRIKTSELNEVLLEAIEKYPPPSVKGKYIKIKYVTQLPSQTPSIALFANLPQYVKEPYRRYIENQIRDNFNFTGVPIQVYFRQK